MKRFIVLAILSVIAGKIFASAMVHFAETTNINTRELNHNLFLQKAADDQLKVSDIPSNLKIAKFKTTPMPRLPQLPPMKAAALQPKAKKLNPKIAQAKTDDAKKKADEDQKEKDRRKKRKKQLEDALARQTPQIAAPTQPGGGAQPSPSPSQIQYAPYNFTNATPPGAVASTSPAPGTKTTTTTSTVIAHPGGTTSTTTSTIQSWIKVLTTAPTASLIANFVALYKSNKFTTTQFYEVLDAMQLSTNTESRYYSVQAAAYYQNINSFKILADESVGETDSTVKTAATTDVDKYGTTADLAILKQALNGDTDEKLVATNLLQTLSVTMVATKTPGSTAKAWLSSFMEVLATLAHDSNSQVQNSATQAYEALEVAMNKPS